MNTYLNPVYPHPSPDPYVLKHGGEYWCYTTGLQPDGRPFGILHSPDLVRWAYVGSALARLPEGVLGVPDTCYWAPEVVYANGRFYLYYSTGNETHMQIRVAVAAHPAGPFEDAGRRLTREDFAIDAHVFEDDDGARYLFYATDFLTHSRIGTGTVADRLLDPLTLAGRPQPVTRARFDWQVYDPQRREKGGVRWHTVEGPFVLKHKGRYYQMFSGGNWQNVTYGVAYAYSDSVLPEGEWTQVSDGERVPPILRTLPRAGVIGPGHNSVVRGPDNRQLFCVYHRWDPAINDRVMAIDRLEFVGDGLQVLGPSTTAQPAPIGPAVAGFGAGWQAQGGQWQTREGSAAQTSAEGAASLRLSLPAEAYLVEVLLAAGQAGTGGAPAYGLRLEDAAGATALELSLRPAERAAVLTRAAQEVRFDLPADFDFAAAHHVRLEVDGRRARLWLDHALLRWEGDLPREPGAGASLALFTQHTGAVFEGFALTVGWQADFDGPRAAPEDWGWQAAEGRGRWQVAEGRLRQVESEAHGATLVKGQALPAYEFVVNVRLLEAAPGGAWGLYPAYAASDDPGPLLTLEGSDDEGWQLVWRPGTALHLLDATARRLEPGHAFPLPRGFDPRVPQQFRFRCAGGQITVQCGALALGGIQAPPRPGRVGVYAHCCTLEIDLARVTGL